MAMDTWRLEGTQHPPWNCKKSPTPRVVVALTVVSSALIAAIIALAVFSGSADGNSYGWIKGSQVLSETCAAELKWIYQKEAAMI
ncbi:unnamed protein product [Lepidochelys kempii]